MTLPDKIKLIQRHVGVTADGAFGPQTAAALIEELGIALPQETEPPPSETQGEMSVAEFIRGYIETHEGGMSVDPVDTGNWFGGKLVGSKYGVTGAALSAYRGGVPLTQADMRALTLDEAVKIGVDMYYRAPGFDKLPWNRVTASIMDMGWGAGPRQSIKLLQRMVGAADDGKLGPATAAKYADYLTRTTEEDAARQWAGVRNAFYDLIIARRPANAKYRRGWYNRSNSFLPGTAWWKAWA